MAGGTLERFTRNAKFEPVEEAVTFDFIDNNKLLQAFGGSESNLVVRNARLFKAIGLDSTRYIHNPEKHWLWGTLDFWTRFFNINPDRWEVKETGGTAWFYRRPFTSLAELEKNLPGMPDRKGIKSWYKEWLKSVQEVFSEFDLVWVAAVEGALTDAYMYTDFSLFFEAMIDAPEIVDYLLEVFTVYGEAVSEAHAEMPTSPIFSQNDDIASTTGSIFPPAFLREKMVPRWKRVYAPAKKAGLQCIFHSDGNVNPLLELLVSEVEIDGFHPVEQAAGMSMTDVRRRYPDLLLLGGISCSQTLPFVPPAQIEQEAYDLASEMVPRGGVFFGSDSEVHELVPVESALAMYRGYKAWKPKVKTLNSLATGKSLSGGV
ncbi:MAG TPA: hypothetical protein VLH40_08175 [Atribacteraceae bacterium]|nr:hypothetical protein [Atribacteraceae bacterium]